MKAQELLEKMARAAIHDCLGLGPDVPISDDLLNEARSEVRAALRVFVEEVGLDSENKHAISQLARSAEACNLLLEMTMEETLADDPAEE